MNSSAPGSSFGVSSSASQGWRDADRTGRSFAERPADAIGHLTDDLPLDVHEGLGAWQSVVSMNASAISLHLSHDAVQYIFTAAINDALTLIRHVNDLDGRSAANSARTLFEHLINLHDVTRSAVNTSDRYLEHRHVTADQVSKNRWWLEVLDGKTKVKEAARLDKLGRRAGGPLRRALEKYGPRFVTGWAEGTIRSRADAYDLTDRYEGYRILSSAIHGSSGALAGIVREVDGEQVHRIGMDLDLAAIAFAEGLHNFYLFAELVHEITSATEALEITEGTGWLIGQLQAVRTALRRIDARNWPTTPPLRLAAVAAMYPNGTVRWFLHDPRDESVTPALPPSPLPDLTALREMARSHDFEEFGGRALSVVVDAVTTVKPGASRFPAASILVPRDHEAVTDVQGRASRR